MQRLNNPYNSLLAGSTAFLDLLSVSMPLRREHFEGTGIEEYGGQIRSARVDSFVSNVFSIPHSRIDGYGLVRKISAEFITYPVLQSKRTRKGTIGEFVYKQYVVERTEKQFSSRTFTQAFVSAFVEGFPELRNQALGFVVNLEDSASVDLDWGNAIAIVMYNGGVLYEHSKLPKQDWRKEIRDRALRTIKILQRKPHAALEPTSVVLSSLGDLSKMNMPAIANGSSTILAATPILRDSINIFLHSDSNVQSLTICGRPDHWLFVRQDELTALWRGLC
jgi:hypothetical protein